MKKSARISTMETKMFDMTLPMGSLNSYIYRVNQIPMLSAEEEHSLAVKFHTTGDLNAARQLVLTHLRLVVRVAQGYLGYGLSQADLIQEGTIGLMKAVKRFDPARGVRLVTFALHWIRAEIHEFILRNWRMVKIATTKAQRKLFFNLRKATRDLHWLNNAETSAVAKNLKVTPEDVRTMETRLSGSDLSFDGAPEEEGDAITAPANYLEDKRFDPALTLEKQNLQEQNSAALKEGLLNLDERSRDIIEQHWLKEGNKATLHTLAAKYHISPERVRQLELVAFAKLKLVVTHLTLTSRFLYT